MVEKEEYFVAVESFAALFELVDMIDSGDYEIAYADELGSWMIPAHMDEVAAAYVKAQARSETDAGFVKAAVQLIIHDKSHGFTLKVYPSAMKFGTEAQLAALGATVQKAKLRTES